MDLKGRPFGGVGIGWMDTDRRLCSMELHSRQRLVMEIHKYNSYLNLYLEEICILCSSSVLTGVFQDIGEPSFKCCPSSLRGSLELCYLHSG